MAKIIEKIKSRPLFFTYIFATEISYMMILFHSWFQFSVDFYKTEICHIATLSGAYIGLPVFFLIMPIFFILSFFRPEIKRIRWKILLFFLLHLFSLTVAFCLWFNGR